MATQLSSSFFAAPPLTPSRLSMVYLAGEAEQAVAAADLPDQSLEETQLATLAEVLIATAKLHLSPPIYTAFLNWAEKAVHLSTRYDGDEEGLARCERIADALADLSSIRALNSHDLALKGYVTMLEVSDSSCFGPLIHDLSQGYAMNKLASGFSSDLGWLSPIPDAIEALTAEAWKQSDDGLAYTVEVGGVMLAAFSGARGEDAALRDALAARPLDGTLIQAFHDHRAEHIRYGDAPDGKEDDDLHDREYQRIEAIYASMPASTPEGLLGKLHTVLRGLNDAAWMGDALINPRGERFKAGLQKADVFTRVMWSAIEDVARMAGTQVTGEAA